MDREEALGRIRSEAWAHCWCHWTGRGFMGSLKVRATLVDMLFVLFYEESPYQRVLLEFLDSHREDQVTVRKTFPIYGVSLDYFFYDVPYDRIPFIMPRFWAKDAGSESRVRMKKGLFMG